MTNKYKKKWLCEVCDSTLFDENLLRAPNPFDSESTIVGCPYCKTINEMVRACDEPGCTQKASCGFPTAGGYRCTCYEHMCRKQVEMWQ